MVIRTANMVQLAFGNINGVDMRLVEKNCGFC